MRCWIEVPDERQTLLFSAIRDPGIGTIAKQYLTNPIEVQIATEEEEQRAR